MTIKKKKKRKKNNSKKETFQKLKRAGNSNVNSISYRIRKTHNIEKFKFICIFNSDKVLKPHS